ncbi:hypothetical protein CSC26_3993 [Pseudomonas aeruginosa]|nr:hypothetical protein CSC26_3993 [Pseudomonas aeruginosa]
MLCSSPNLNNLKLTVFQKIQILQTIDWLNAQCIFYLLEGQWGISQIHYNILSLLLDFFSHSH